MPITRHVLLASMLWAGSWAVPAAAGPSTVKFALEMDGRVVLPVRINGQGPFRMRLDTGASRTVLAAGLARRLGLAAQGRTRVMTPTGVDSSALARVDAVEAGCGGPVAVSALVLPEAALDPTGSLDGLVGQDVLSALTYTIDYRCRRLTCHDALPARLPGLSLPLAIEGGRALVLVPVRDRPGIALVPDTGADRLVLFGDAAGHGLQVTPIDHVRLRSVSGQRRAQRVLIHGLELDGTAGAGREGLIVEADGAGRWMGDGLLPLHHFARVTFDGPGGRLVVADR